ncbi:MAG: hypothetical protein IGS23_25595 [Rivularia sp. T60_A2020_040]|nr:hypothetical protein [Rivularia sp. T60_A2020_040]
MIVTVRDPSILSNLDPMQITAYLQSRGWLQESRVDDKESVWVISINDEEYDEFSITLPLNPKTRSYALRMAEILETLERAEGRSQLDILSDLVTNIPLVEIQGLVIRLAEHKNAGNAIIMGFVVGKPQQIQIRLNEEEYKLAQMAYTERLVVESTGDLIKENGIFILSNKRKFALYDTLSDKPQTLPS